MFAAVAASGRLLRADELEREPRLRWIAAALLFFHYWTFANWYGEPLLVAGAPGLVRAPTWLFDVLGAPSFGEILTARLFLAAAALSALWGVGLLFLARFDAALTILAGLSAAKLYVYLGDVRLATNYHHTHLFLSVVFLACPAKLFFVRVALGAGYALAAVAKLSPSWVRGEYLSSLAGGVPLLPRSDAAAAFAGAALLAWELGGPALWLSSSARLRQGSVAAFAAFHAFSATLVGYRYPALMLPVLLAAFWRFERPLQHGYRYARGHARGWALLAVAAVAGVWPFVIPGDVRSTGEGRLLGLFMFEVNRASRAELELAKGGRRIELDVDWPWTRSTVLRDGSIEKGRPPSMTTRFFEDGRLVETFDRPTQLRDEDVILVEPAFFTETTAATAQPYLLYLYVRELCRRWGPDRVGVRFLQRLDGAVEPAVVVDERDFCARPPTYRPFVRNDWIRR
ncbi:MAG: hypothetical protein HY553_20040 [Elusimicrobia bacterium]|nr:hypothetical protein [Elusimicrobiota bacterium]